MNEEKEMQQPDEQQSEKPKHIEYGLGKNALIPKIYNRTIDKWKNVRLVEQRLSFNQWIIIQCN